VLIAQRWVLAALRNRTFFSLGELNEAIAELREKLNARPFQKLDGCRRSRFEQLDRPAMRPLPARRYELAEWKKAKVNIDYLVAFEDRLYSVPYALIGAYVELRATGSTIEILHNGVRVASHARSYAPKGALVVDEAHRPRAHRDWRSWPPERVVSWAATSGPHVGQLASQILARQVHPEAGYRACLGVIRLGERYGAARLDAACARALAITSPSFKSVKAILKAGLDSCAPAAEREPAPQRALFDHENIRGPGYFDKGGLDAERRDDSKVARPEDEPHGNDAEADDLLAADGTSFH
jgi:transposase